MKDFNYKKIEDYTSCDYTTRILEFRTEYSFKCKGHNCLYVKGWKTFEMYKKGLKSVCDMLLSKPIKKSTNDYYRLYIDNNYVGSFLEISKVEVRKLAYFKIKTGYNDFHSYFMAKKSRIQDEINRIQDEINRIQDEITRSSEVKLSVNLEALLSMLISSPYFRSTDESLRIKTKRILLLYGLYASGSLN